MNRPAPIPVLSDQHRTKSIIWSRTSCGTQAPVRVPQSFFLARYAPPSARPEPRLWSGFSSPDIRYAPARPDGSARLSARRPPRRSQRIPFAIDRRPSAADLVLRTGPIPPRSPPDVASEWRLSPLLCNASAASSRALSVILTVKRFLHFQLRRDTSSEEMTWYEWVFHANARTKPVEET